MRNSIRNDTRHWKSKTLLPPSKLIINSENCNLVIHLSERWQRIITKKKREWQQSAPLYYIDQTHNELYRRTHPDTET